MKAKNIPKVLTGIAFTGIILIFAVTFLVPPAPVAASTAPRIYKMEGHITAIDLKFNTVVIDVPITEKKIFRVGGPLAKGAILKRGDKTDVSLKDFKVGDKVVVEWEQTPQGHLIKMLEAR